ncbi:transporter [Zunongwangia sp. HGR-M22]|uniref:transporter n=1 Tax=Zunongwangia sp. HGR-M22 TaxID=3015168 RepID=UPI0022DD1F1E|nr:transporter [Zunongwangia sp. HGR-M22]WBL26434.1 transporter [Zunongwangia sp. HGR-M22]
MFCFYLVKAETSKDSTAVFSNFNFEYDDCDVCGCGSSGGSMGYGTIGNGDFVGLRYIHQQYKSKDGIYNNSPWIDENFNTLQAWARIPVTRKIKVNVIVPYHFHNREFNDGSTQDINGLGDISILGFYKLISPKLDGFLPEQQTKFKHNLEVGAGVKLPTGEYERSNNEGSVNPSFQVGTGSWDILFASNYSVSYNNWGLGALANYTIKTENEKKYHFGDQFTYGINLYRSFITMNAKTFTPISITPILGLSGEVFGENKSYGLPVKDTKGDILFSRIGVESNYGKISGGVNLMLPVSQNLNAGNVEAKMRLGIHLNFVL